jgi:hypothetical protein
VIGTHGRKGLGKLFLGSVAEQIFRHANCLVLTVGPRSFQNSSPSSRRHSEGGSNHHGLEPLHSHRHGLSYALGHGL